VVFLQGCNFDCVACHNPSTINVCDSCAVCVDQCPPGALTVSAGLIVFDLDACDGCDLCLGVCPVDSSPMVREMLVADIVGEIRPHAAFLSGVTATGGEPTLQLDFLVALFDSIKADPDLRHLTTLVDTNGTLAIEGWERLAPVLDGAMVDLKAGTARLHRQLTGHGDAAVRASIRWLHDHEKLAEVRLLVVEGVTDTEAELHAWAAFVGGLGADIPVRLMAFRHQGTRPQARSWPETSTAALDRVERRLADYGLTSVVR
jgi:YjjW family glycine radical enzyme activase